MKITHAIGYLIWPKLNGSYFDAQNLGALLREEITARTQKEAEAILVLRRSIIDAITRLKARHIDKIRLGISWIEWESIGGRQWIEWYLDEFHRAGYDILPCLNYTPEKYAQARIDAHRLTVKPTTNIPPEPLKAFGDFTDEFLRNCGNKVGKWIELWNEPNIDSDWHPEIGTIPLFVEMLSYGSQAARAHDKHVLMGGLSGVKEEWLTEACTSGLLDHVDAIGLHGLRGTWSDKKQRPSWRERIESLQKIMAAFDTALPVWLTETGFSTLDLEFKIPQEELERIQVAIFAELLEVLIAGHSPMVYWYADTDLISPSVRFVTTGWEDIIQYYFGDTDVAGHPKLLRTLLEEGGPEHVLEYVKEHALMPLAATILDRKSPEDWSEEKLREIIQKKDGEARTA